MMTVRDALAIDVALMRWWASYPWPVWLMGRKQRLIAEEMARGEVARIARKGLSSLSGGLSRVEASVGMGSGEKTAVRGGEGLE